MKFDFLLVTSWSDFDTRIQTAIAEELERKGHQTAILTPTRSSAKIVGDTPTRTFILESISADRTLNSSEIENTFALPGLPYLCKTEQAYYHLSYETVHDRAVSIASKLETLFSKHTFEYSLQGRGGELFRLLVDAKMKHVDRNNIWNTFSPFEESIAFSTNLNARWDSYETVPFEDITEAERSSVRQYMDSFREKKERYTHEEPDSKGGVNKKIVPQIGQKIRQLQGLIWSDRPRNIKNSIFSQLRKLGYENVNKSMLPGVGESRKKCERTQYVFFPLQFKEESRLTVFSPEFYDQRWLIEYLSRSIPHDVELFIKQHPNHAGQESPAWIKRMSQKHNISFLNPETNAHYCIKNAESVVVTNNTVGFEALFYSTPLIVLGNAFYSDVPAAQHVEDLSNLSSVISESIVTSTPEEKRIASIHSLREATYQAPDHSDTKGYADSVSTHVSEFVETLD